MGRPSGEHNRRKKDFRATDMREVRAAIKQLRSMDDAMKVLSMQHHQMMTARAMKEKKFAEVKAGKKPQGKRAAKKKAKKAAKQAIAQAKKEPSKDKVKAKNKKIKKANEKAKEKQAAKNKKMMQSTTKLKGKQYAKKQKAYYKRMEKRQQK